MYRLTSTLDGAKQLILGIGELVLNAWGITKVSSDFSIISGLFTNNIPKSKWNIFSNGVRVSSDANVVSINGMLVISSGNGTRRLQTRKNPRYQPNRGLIYSSSIIVDTKDNNANHDFGCGTIENAAFFRVRDGEIYACIKYKINGTVTTIEELILDLPKGLDLSKGNIYDIQMQWRGVGNISFFIGDETSGASKKVHSMSLLNNLDRLSITNPALPLFFQVEKITQDGTLRCGCVDLSSEGGYEDKGEYGSIGMITQTGSVSITGLNIPILAVHIKDTYNGNINTRDVLSLLASAYSDNRSVFRVWQTTDETALILNQQTWTDYGDGNMRFVRYDQPDVVTPMSLDMTKADLIFTARVDMDSTYSTSALFEGRTDIYLTPGEYLIFTMHRENGASANVGVTYEFSELI